MEKNIQSAATAAQPTESVMLLAEYIAKLPFFCDALSVKPTRNDSGRGVVTFCQVRNGQPYPVLNPNETYVGSDGRTYRAKYQMVISANLYRDYLEILNAHGDTVAISFLVSSPISVVTSQTGESFAMGVSSGLKPETGAIRLDR